MHPAPSIIAFTTFSGLGFGLLFWLGLGFPAVDGWVALVFHLVAYGLAVGGLLASALHLGNPQRALRAFTQWRTSWLSREAVLAMAALTVTGLHGFCLIFLGLSLPLLGWAGSALCLLTVLATSMIYAQLKTVPRWNHWTTPALFLALSLAGGAALAAQSRLAGLLLLATGGLQIVSWRLGDRRFAARPTSLASATGLGATGLGATGLGATGSVRLFAPPHTGTNYLLKEMVHRIGRKHSRRLRVIALACMSLIPAAVLLAGPGHLAAAVAILLHVAGTLTARWLFFAEAEHVVGLYYGAHSGSDDQASPARR